MDLSFDIIAHACAGALVFHNSMFDIYVNRDDIPVPTFWASPLVGSSAILSTEKNEANYIVRITPSGQVEDESERF